MTARKTMLLEVCIASVDDAIAAEEGGAGRLELNIGLELGGLTPSIGLLRATVQATTLPVLPMLRPRPGGFHYSETEKEIMIQDGKQFLAEGAAGLVFGALNKDNQIDASFTRKMVQLCGKKESVYHRAIDAATDPVIEAKKLVDLGITRILTSGGAKTALEGAEVLKQLQDQIGHRIEILPASGIRSSNVQDLVTKTGVNQVHGSCGRTYQNPSGPVAPPDCRMTDVEEVRQMKTALRRFR